MGTPLHTAQRFGSDRPTEDPYNQSATPFLEGIIRDVDSEKWTCEVKTLGLDQSLQDVRIMSPYFNFTNGHGIFQIPEIGSMCVVSRTQSDWFVVGFIPPSDVDDTEGTESDEATTGSQNLSDPFLGQVAAIQDRLLKQEQGGNGIPKRHSFRSNREGDMIPGDGCAKTSAGNKFKWFTNGNLLAEASKLCQRIWSRLQNQIIDIAVRYSLLTPGVQKEITVSDDTKEVLETIRVRRTTDDDTPQIQIKRGFITDEAGIATNFVYEFIVQDNSGVKHRITIGTDGERLVTIGNPSLPAVKVEAKPNGEYNLTTTTTIKIDAPSIVVGKGGEDFLVKLSALLVKYNAHTHNGNLGAPTGPVLSGILDASDGTIKLKGG